MFMMEGAFNLLMVALAVATVIGLQIMLNKLSGSRFDDTLREASNDARLRYFSYRTVAIFIMAGLILS